jgi:hypothetical protein
MLPNMAVPDDPPTSVEKPLVRELASGFDGLYLSGRCELPEAFVAMLDDARERAADEDVLIDLGGVEFAVSPGGLPGGYRYRVTHPAGALGFSTSEDRPAVRVQTRASALHSLGPRPTVEFFAELLNAELGSVLLSPSRVDLFADFQGLEVDVDRRREFVARARKRTGHEEDDDFNGLNFGRRKSGTISARIYDKTAEIGGRDSYWPDLWAPNYDPSRHVDRVEYELARRGLVQLGMPTLDALWEGTAAAWAYLTDEWLTHRTPNGDPNRSRWPVSDQWRAVQQASIRNRSLPAERIIEVQRAASIASIVPGIVGYLSSLADLEGATNLHDTLGIAASHVLDYCERTETSFEERIAAKSHKRRLR